MKRALHIGYTFKPDENDPTGKPKIDFFVKTPPVAAQPKPASDPQPQPAPSTLGIRFKKAARHPRRAFIDHAERTQTAISKNQKDYVRAKIGKLATRLTDLIRAHNPALSLAVQTVPETGLLVMRIYAGTPRLKPRYLGIIQGRLDIRWAHENGRGKELTFTGHAHVAESEIAEVAATDIRKYKELAQNLFATLKNLGLPQSRSPRILPVWKRALKTIEIPESLTNPPEANAPLKVFEDAHIAYIQHMVRYLGRNFRNQYCARNPIFQDMNADYDRATKRLTLTFRPREAYAGTLPVFELEGGISMIWTHGGGRGTKVLFTPDKGLNLSSSNTEALNIHERHKASQSLMNMILAAGFVQNVETFESEKHGISMIFNVRDNEEGFTPQGRPREEKRKRDNNHNFEAKVKRGDLRSFTLH